MISGDGRPGTGVRRRLGFGGVGPVEIKVARPDRFDQALATLSHVYAGKLRHTCSHKIQRCHSLFDTFNLDPFGMIAERKSMKYDGDKQNVCSSLCLELKVCQMSLDIARFARAVGADVQESNASCMTVAPVCRRSASQVSSICVSILTIIHR